MEDKEFLKLARKEDEYKILIEYKSPSLVEADLLEIKHGRGITEEYWEYKFTVDKDCLKSENPHIKDFLQDIQEVFDKYKDKGINIGDWDTKGSSTPMGLNFVETVLSNQ